MTLLLWSWDFYEYYDHGQAYAELADIDPDELLWIWEANQEFERIDLVNVWKKTNRS